MEIYAGLGGSYKISIEDRVGQHHQLAQLPLHSRKTRTITCNRKCCKPSIVLKTKIYKLWETPIWWLLLKPNWKIQSHHVHRDCAYPGNFGWNKLADNHGVDGKTLELILIDANNTSQGRLPANRLHRRQIFHWAKYPWDPSRQLEGWSWTLSQGSSILHDWTNQPGRTMSTSKGFAASS